MQHSRRTSTPGFLLLAILLLAVAGCVVLAAIAGPSGVTAFAAVLTALATVICAVTYLCRSFSGSGSDDSTKGAPDELEAPLKALQKLAGALGSGPGVLDEPSRSLPSAEPPRPQESSAP